MPEPIHSSITVVETISAEAPASVTRLDAERVAELPGVHMDDRLRLVPGFSLFRRNSSVSANPTTQGVSFRGIGSTGASRALVLWDGLPLNDPFGGWVYWNRVAPEELDRAEVTRAAYTSVFGDRAMGGSLGLFSREPAPRRFSLGWDFGNRGQQQVSGSGSHVFSRWAVSAQARAFTWDGYYLVPENLRGEADSLANSRFASGAFRVDYLGGRDRLFVRSDFLAEDRENGTNLQYNSTGLGLVGGNYIREITPATSLSLLGFHSRQQFRASFSTISADRNTERLTSLQTVPSDSSGGAAMMRHSGSRVNWIAGADFVHVEGYSSEQLFPPGLRFGGGTQFQFGVFGQGDVTLGPVKLFGGLRYHDAGEGNRFWGPSGGVSAGRGRSRWRASGFRGFRAPTLNELFRDFRAGNAVTLANPLLAPETLTGTEAGYDFHSETFRASATGFYNTLNDLVTNVTLSQTPTLITRQRRNAGTATVRGIEADVRKRLGRWEGVLAYLYTDSRFAAGERLPQVAKQQGTAQVSWRRASTMLTGGFRVNSLAFEDDRNQFVLPGFLTWHASGSQQLWAGLSAIFALENAFNREYLAGAGVVPLLAAPRLMRLGVRYDFGARRP